MTQHRPIKLEVTHNALDENKATYGYAYSPELIVSAVVSRELWEILGRPEIMQLRMEKIE